MPTVSARSRATVSTRGTRLVSFAGSGNLIFCDMHSLMPVGFSHVVISMKDFLPGFVCLFVVVVVVVVVVYLVLL